MTPRFAALFTAALLAAAPALAQPRAGESPNPVGGAPAPAFRTGPADWTCHDGRCTYGLVPHTSGEGWTRCTASWFPTHGGWRKQNICH